MYHYENDDDRSYDGPSGDFGWGTPGQIVFW